MAKIDLIEYTGKGRADERWHAAHLLMFTKSTRLTMDGCLMKRIGMLSDEEKMDELRYMANTIPSSWEFADVTFLICGVSRACAQQITRTRTASFAMQSQRVVNASDINVVNPLPPGDRADYFDTAVNLALDAYNTLVDSGVELGDARGILPMNSECNLVAKYNFRNFIELVRARSSLRVQGEYADVVRQMKEAVVDAWPWAEMFMESNNRRAIDIIERIAQELGIKTGVGLGWELAKAADLLRK